MAAIKRRHVIDDTQDCDREKRRCRLIDCERGAVRGHHQDEIRGETLGASDVVRFADRAAFRIISIVPLGNDFLVTWQGGVGSTGVVQTVNGDYSTNFNDISSAIVIPGSGTTNYADPVGPGL